MSNNESMHTFSFYYLEEKKNKLIPIISQYTFPSAVQAVFTINSWRNNRGAQESCLALNLALKSNENWGDKTLITYDDFFAFFNEIYPILKVGILDDPVLCDFGELKLNYENHYYSVITGTGHTACVFAALQYLEPISNYCSMNQVTEELLQYSNTMLDQLLASNVQIFDDFSNNPKFECPSENYFSSVIDFFSNEAWYSLPRVLLNMMNSDDNIIQCHFVSKDDVIYPLFNPSLIIDYFTSILSLVPTNMTSKIVKETLALKIKNIYCYKKDKKTKLFTRLLLLNNHNKIELNNNCFVFMQDEKIILFLESSDSIQKTIKEIEDAFNHHMLSIVDLNDNLEGNRYKGYQFDEHCLLSFLIYDNHLDVEEEHISLGQKGGLRVYTAIDLMYMLLISDSLNQIVEFDKHESDETQVFSYGVSDYYSVYLKEMGYISKGAIEYNHLYFECDSAASLLLMKYLTYNKVFPFQICSNKFPSPEHWNINVDENAVNQFMLRSRELLGGSLFIFENKSVIFSSYDLQSILESGDYQQINMSLEFFRGIIERFLNDFRNEISHIDSISNKIIWFKCHSLHENGESDKYVLIKKLYKNNDSIYIDYSVDCNKLMSDISTVNDRSVEYSLMLDLMSPFLAQSNDSEQLKNIVLSNMSKQKTVDTTAIKIEYYYNTKSMCANIEEKSILSARKKLAQIIMSNCIVPGVYEQKEATSIVRKMQEEAITTFETMVSQFDKYSLHSIALSFYASEIFSDKFNRQSFELCADIDETIKIDSMEKTQNAIERAKNKQATILYLIESNLHLTAHKKQEPSDEDISTLLAYAEWIVELQNVSDLCFHTDSKSKLIILDDYRADVEVGDRYASKYDACIKRRLLYKSYNAIGDEDDFKYIDRFALDFKEDTGIEYKLFISIMYFLSIVGFDSTECPFDEIKENVMRVNIQSFIKSFNESSCETFEIDEIKKAVIYLSIDCGKLKELKGKSYPILPIWDRENRDNRFDVKPILKIENDIIYSPIVLHYLKERWVSGMMQFIIPYEIGLDKSIEVLKEWKQYYEHKFSADIDDYFAEMKFEYHKHDVDIRREDRSGNHPNINVLGDYDVIGVSKELKKIFLIECKVLHPIGSVFEHSNEQKRFFFEEKYDEKFQKRIDYFMAVYSSFFANNGIDFSVDEFEICPFLVVNKVFDSFYKEVSFPIVTFDELKNIIENSQ